MHRRQFLKNKLLIASTSIAGVTPAFGLSSSVKQEEFKLKYAPHFGMFKESAGDDLLDQLQFMYDNGFRALEDNGMPKREVGMQEKIASKMGNLGMEMGVFVAYANFQEAKWVTGKKEHQEEMLAAVKDALPVAKRVNAKWMTVVPGTYDQKLPWDYQTANCIELLKRCSALLEPHEIIMVLEPLNWHTNHPGVFLTKIPQAYQITKAVNSPSCKILNDLYHQQITEGNLIPNIDQAWNEIAYIQVGDNPGRKEPTTGEINYKNVFRHLHGKGYTGIVGMEHGNSLDGKKGEEAVIKAYQQVDNF